MKDDPGPSETRTADPLRGAAARPIPAATVPANPHYDLIGGEAVVRALVDRFYALMDTRPEARALRDLHPDDLAGSKEKLFMFLSGWLGGPPLYAQRVGPPRLGMAHFRFPIDDAMRDAWMVCMTTALEELVPDASLRNQLSSAFFKTANHLRNR